MKHSRNARHRIYSHVYIGWVQEADGNVVVAIKQEENEPNTHIVHLLLKASTNDADLPMLIATDGSAAHHLMK